MGFSTADEKTLLAECRKSGLLPEDIEGLKRLADEKYARALAYRYWAACVKLRNANELLHAARQAERVAKRLAELEVKIADGYR